MRSLSLAVGLLMTFLNVGLAGAATPVRIRLETDGSVVPPGDRIDVLLVLDPGETNLTLSVRAFLVSGDNNQIVTPVRASKNVHQDEQGNLLLIETFNGQVGVATSIRRSIHIPYEDMSIPVGRHQVGYVVTGTGGLASGEISFAQATPLTTMTITENARTKMIAASSPPKSITRERETRAILVDKTGTLQREFTIKYAVPSLQEDKSTKEIDVQISGGFERSKARYVEPDELNDPKIDYVNALKKSPWIPVSKRMLHYATNRNLKNPGVQDGRRFGSDVAASVNYGTLLANIPAASTHKRGNLEHVGWWERRDPKKHFYIDTINDLAKEDFLHTIKDSNDVLIFVHGYNNSFEDAALRLAQLSHDLKFPGNSLLFSWPSQGSEAAYKSDEMAAADSVGSLTEVLDALVRRKEIGRIHVIAHSMGNRIFMRSVHALSQRINAGAKPFGHVVLVAPDVDVRNFVAFFPAVNRLSASVSLYYNADDWALRASRVFHVDSRAGEMAIFDSTLQNINAQKANTSILGHDYFATVDVLLVDLQLLLNFNLSPTKRPTLSETQNGDGFTLWFFP